MNANQMLSASDRAACAVLSQWLQAQSALALWGLAASTLAAALLLARPMAHAASTMLLGAALLVGAAERYLAVRVGLDAGLFGDMASGRIASLPLLDASLGRTGLRAAPTASSVRRGLEDRLRGARRLVRGHMATLAAQALLLAGAGLW